MEAKEGFQHEYVHQHCRVDERRENIFIKNNIPRDIDSSRGYVKAFKSFMEVAIAKKNTFLGTKGELMLVIGAQIWPTGTPKQTQRGIIRFGLIQPFKGSFKVDDFTQCAINKKSGC
jgi:hypothetical protein